VGCYGRPVIVNMHTVGRRSPSAPGRHGGTTRTEIGVDLEHLEDLEDIAGSADFTNSADGRQCEICLCRSDMPRRGPTEAGGSRLRSLARSRPPFFLPPGVAPGGRRVLPGPRSERRTATSGGKSDRKFDRLRSPSAAGVFGASGGNLSICCYFEERS
jgi:hypothetical protein